MNREVQQLGEFLAGYVPIVLPIDEPAPHCGREFAKMPGRCC